LRSQKQVVEDSLLTEYIQNLGEKLSSKVQSGDFDFNYFLVPQNSINAFAIPGGFIGIHTGLCINADNESQLASVLSHEISHVTQRHISRQIGDQVPNSIQGGLVLLGAVLLSAVTGSGEILEAGASIVPSLLAQGQIDFTREMEIEADAIGIKTMGLSGYDPYAMADFFNKLSTGDDPRYAASVEFLRTHPTSVNRASSAKKQARKIDVDLIEESLGFELARARIRYLFGNTPEKTFTYFNNKTKNLDLNKPLSNRSIGELYGFALSSIDLGYLDQAESILIKLSKEYAEFGHFHIAYMNLLIAKGMPRESISYITERVQLSPRNIPITLAYAETELNYGSPKKSHEILLDLFNNIPPTPPQIKLIANSANRAGDIADSFSYMAEYYLSLGNFKEATEQFKIALSLNSLTKIQASRFMARLIEIEEYMQEMKQANK
jgi:predicted Zn-dependent protease